MQFKATLKEKDRKHLRGSGKKAKKKKRKTERKWWANEDRWNLREKLKLVEYLLIIFKKLSTFKVYEFFSLALDNSCYITRMKPIWLSIFPVIF